MTTTNHATNTQLSSPQPTSNQPTGSQPISNQSATNQGSANPHLTPVIQVETWQSSQLDEYLALYHSSGIKRPLADKPRMAQLFQGANLLLSARIDGKLVGLARCLTDGAYVCYVSDLLVAGECQRQGIGRLLLQTLAEKLGPQVQLLLLSAPTAMTYYPKMGFAPLNNAFAIERQY
jgi:GNAT superfamily N-acetyltransferase